MSYRPLNSASTSLYLIGVLLLAAFLLMVFVRPDALAGPQERRSHATQIERGKYIVEGVAGCGYCHTPRDKEGNPDRSRWLEGAPVFYEPARPVDGWANTVPRLAGLPPGSDEELIRLLTTAVSRTGKAPRWPMPRFYMTRTDAEAVVAYLKSIDVKH